MDYTHVRDIDFQANINNRVFGIFLARDVDVRLQKDGVTKFISVNLCDKDFKIEAKKFGATDSEIGMMKNGGVYCAAIDIKPYAKSPTGYSCTLYNFDVYNEDPANFIEWAEGMDEAHDTIQRALTTISESIYKDLVYNIKDSNSRKDDYHDICRRIQKWRYLRNGRQRISYCRIPARKAR